MDLKRHIFNNKSVKLRTTIVLVKSLILNTVLLECESWALFENSPRTLRTLVKILYNCFQIYCDLQINENFMKLEL